MSQRNRPDRVLVATPIVEQKLYAWPELVEGLKNQQTELLYDWLIVDNTPDPSPGYVEWLKDFCASMPLGPRHRVRLARFGESVDGLQLFHSAYRILYAERLIFEKFSRWSSYDHLLELECDIVIPPHALQTLYQANLEWAAAWLLTRRMHDPLKPQDETEHRFPLLFHGLTRERYLHAETISEVMYLGYQEPPSAEPFPCLVTHLACTLIRGSVIRSVPFPMTTAGGDIAYSWAVGEAGYQPHCVPAVAPEHIAHFERPAFAPWATGQLAETADIMGSTHTALEVTSGI